MARSFLAFTLALAAEAVILFGVAVTPAAAQPKLPAMPSAAPKPKKYPEVQEALQLLLAKRDTPAAIKKLEEASRRYPELPSGHVLMYQILAQLSQPAAARLQLDEAARANPSDPEPYIILGEIALQEKRIAEAMLDFDKAKRLLAAYTNAGRKATLEKQLLRGIAKVAETREDWKEAETRLRDLLKVAPEDLDAHKRLALSLFQRGKVKDAYDVLKAAKKIDRENANKYRTRSVFPAPEEIIAHDFDKREGPKATNEEKWHKAAIEDAPDDLATRQAATIWALENGKLAFAKEQADAALRIESSDAKKYSGSNVGRTLRGVVALWEKDWSTAENYFQKIIDASPTDFVARNIMALALVEQDDPQKKQLAQAYADANYKDNNKSPDALSTLGWVYFRRGEFDQAKLALGEAVKATGGNLNNADTATYLAHILYQQDQKWQTKELLDNILKGDRPFSMRHEAEKLYEKVKDEKRPESAPATKTP